MRAQLQDKQKFLEYLSEMPNISAVCKRIGIHRSVFYRWCKEDSAFEKDAAAAMQSGRDSLNDLAQGKLVKHIQNDSLSAITFHLRHQHPDYTDRRPSVPEQVGEAVLEPEPLPDIPIPDEAYASVDLGKLNKRLRKQAVRGGMTLFKDLDETINKMWRNGKQPIPKIVLDQKKKLLRIMMIATLRTILENKWVTYSNNKATTSRAETHPPAEGTTP